MEDQLRTLAGNNKLMLLGNLAYLKEMEKKYGSSVSIAFVIDKELQEREEIKKWQTKKILRTM